MSDGRATPLDSIVRRVWIVLAVSALAFAGIAIVVSGGVSDMLDRRLLLLLRDPSGNPYGPYWLQEAVGDVTALGSYTVLVIATAFTLAGLLIMRKHAAACFLALALVGGSVLSTALKLVFERGRPDIVEQLDRTFTSSFPSAHAMVSMLAWLTLAAVLARFVARPALRALVLGGALVLSLMIGTSRIYLGVHWPSDVLAGWFAGLAWASACWLTAHYLSRIPWRRGRLGKSADAPPDTARR